MKQFFIYLCVQVINLIGKVVTVKYYLNCWGNPPFINHCTANLPYQMKRCFAFITNGCSTVIIRKKLLDFLNMPVIENIALCEYSPALILEGINRQTHTNMETHNTDRSGYMMLFSRVKKKVFSKFFTIFNYNFVLNGNLVGYEEINLLCLKTEKHGNK